MQTVLDETRSWGQPGSPGINEKTPTREDSSQWAGGQVLSAAILLQTYIGISISRAMGDNCSPQGLWDVKLSVIYSLHLMEVLQRQNLQLMNRNEGPELSFRATAPLP